MDLTLQHPDYVATAAARTTGRDLYDGDAAVKAKGERYLYKGKNEADADYDLRLKRAVLDPYIEKIINARMAVLFRKEHTRTLPPGLKAWVNDVDRKGTPATTFFADAARDAQVDGIHWVLIDMPKLPTISDEDGMQAPVDYVSADHEKEAGHRPFFEHVPGVNVIDWLEGPDKQPLWVKISQSSEAIRDNWGTKHKTLAQYKVWTRSEWVLYEEPEGGGEPVEKERGPNPTKVVPLVPFLGKRRTDFSGTPVAESVFPHIISIYNKTSDMDWFERVSAHPIPWTISPEKPEFLDAGKGIWLKSAANGAHVAIGYLEATGSAFESIRKSCNDLKEKIFSIALAQARKDSAQVQAADSQREDQRSLTSSLKTVSMSYEAQELRCWQIAALWAQDKGATSVAYDRDFDDASIEAEMIGSLLELMDRSLLTRKTVLGTIVRGELVDVQDVDKELTEAAKESATATGDAAAATLERMRRAEDGDDEQDDTTDTGITPDAGA